MDDTDNNIDQTLPGDDSDIENLDNSIIANVDGDWRLPQKQTEVTAVFCGICQRPEDKAKMQRLRTN